MQLPTGMMSRNPFRSRRAPSPAPTAKPASGKRLSGRTASEGDRAALPRNSIGTRQLDAGEQPLLQAPKRGQQVAIVDRRNKPRHERFKRPRVVPVVDVAAVLRHLAESPASAASARGIRGSVRYPIRTRPVASSAAGRGWWAKRGRPRRQFLLHVVGDQPVVLSGAELSEVAPGVKGGAS